jgi:hypothetical protein
VGCPTQRDPTPGRPLRITSCDAASAEFMLIGIGTAFGTALPEAGHVGYCEGV